MKSLVFAACIFAVAFAAPRLRRQSESEEEAAGAVVLSLNALCRGFREIGEAYDEFEDKRSWDTVIEGIERLCNDLDDTQFEQLDLNGDGEIDEAELDSAAEGLIGVFAELCKAVGEMFEGQKRSWESVFTNLFMVCMDLKATIMADLENKRSQGPQKLSKEEFEQLVEACEELKNADSDKRGDIADLERACRKLGKALADKAPEDKREPPKLSKEEFEQLVEACEELKNADSDKRGDLADLERACRKLGKALAEKKPAEDKRAPPKLSKEEFEQLVAACEELKNADSDKRGDIADLERACRKLGKALADKADKAPEEKRAPPKLSKEEFEQLVAACEELKNADSDKRGDIEDLEKACRKLGKALADKADKAPEEKREPPKLSKEEFEQLVAACEELKNADSDKRGDIADLERACRKLGKALADKADKAPEEKREPPKLSKEEFEQLVAACEELKNADSDKRGDIADLERACRKLGKALADKADKAPEEKREPPKLSKEEFEQLVEACEELKNADSDKRGDLADLERACRRLGKALAEKKPVEDKRAPPKLSKEEFEQLVAACEELKDADSDKRGDIADLERACRKLGKALADKADKEAPEDKRMQGQNPEEMTEEEFMQIVAMCQNVLGGDDKRDMKELKKACEQLKQELEKLEDLEDGQDKRGKGKGRRPPKTDENGNTLPPPPPKDELSEDDFIALVEACEELAEADDDKRDDMKDLERACRKLAKALENLETDEDGNPLPPPTKPAEDKRRVKLLKGAQLARRSQRPKSLCESESRPGPKPTEEPEKKRGKGRRPAKTDENGNTLPPPPPKDELSEDDFVALVEACEELAEADDDKRDDMKDLERACRKLAKFLENVKTDEDGNFLPPPTKSS